MTRALPRTNFHSSKLLRCLADLGMVDAAEAGNGFAEKLGDWLHFSDAITLSAVHNDSTAGTPALRPDQQSAARVAAVAEFDRIQAVLANSITQSCSPNPGKTHIKLPTPAFDLPLDLRAAYAPYGRFHEAHQRDMEMLIQPLRVNVRAALAKVSPVRRKLAELDAMFDKILREREKQLLAKLPVLLKKRFEHLFNEHQQKLAETQQPDNPATWTKTGGWLARFCQDMQMLLLAEMELRLQPTMGLIEAFNEAFIQKQVI
jgi:hypothetical protein